MILFTLVVFTSFCECTLNWQNDLEKTLIHYSHTQRIALFLNNRNGPYAHQINQLLLRTTKTFPTSIFTDNNEGNDPILLFGVHSYTPLSTLLIYTVEITGKITQRNLSDKISRGLRIFWMPVDVPALLVVIFGTQKISDGLISNAFKSVFLRKRIEFSDYHLKVITVIESGTHLKSSFLTSEFESTALMHEYNPFTKRYSIRNISSIRKVIFPWITMNLDKRNLRLRISLQDRHLNVSLNSKGCPDPKSLERPNGLLLKVLSETGNFSWKIIITETNQLPVNLSSKCISNKQIPQSLLNEDVHVFGSFIHFPYLRSWTNSVRFNKMYGMNLMDMLKYIQVRRTDPLVAIVPILRASALTLSDNFLTFFIATVVIIFTIKIAIRIMKYDSNFWTVKNIWFTIFGMGVRDTTKTVGEKFILCSILFVSVVYSISIIDKLLDIQIHLNSKVKIKTLNDFIATNLTFMLPEYFTSTLNDTEIPLYQRFAKTAITQKNFFEAIQNCINNLTHKSNDKITCLDYYAEAQRHIRQSKINGNELNIAILNDYILQQWLILPISPRMTFAKRFEQVIQYLNEAGIINKWNDDELYKSDTNKSIKAIENTELSYTIIRQLIFIIAGYIASTFILFIEIMASMSKKIRNLLFMWYFQKEMYII